MCEIKIYTSTEKEQRTYESGIALAKVLNIPQSEVTKKRELFRMSYGKRQLSTMGKSKEVTRRNRFLNGEFKESTPYDVCSNHLQCLSNNMNDSKSRGECKLIIFGRHGQKDPEGKLTQVGLQQWYDNGSKILDIIKETNVQSADIYIGHDMLLACILRTVLGNSFKLPHEINHWSAPLQMGEYCALLLDREKMYLNYRDKVIILPSGILDKFTL